MTTLTLRRATQIAGTLGYPSKMPGTSTSISAKQCITGSKLAKIPGSVCHGCYAMKGNYLYPSVKTAHARRLAGIQSPLWTSAMVTLLLTTHKRGKGRAGKKIKRGWHRWFDSGDLQSIEHLTKICAVAALTPAIRHWLPTRELGIVSAYKAQGGIVPNNLTIRISATMVDGPATKAWPTTSGVFHKLTPPDGAHVCPAPQQEGKCGVCRACWSSDVKHVVYHLH